MDEISNSPFESHTDKISGENNIEEIRKGPQDMYEPLHPDFTGGRP